MNDKKSKAKIVKLNQETPQSILDLVFKDLKNMDEDLELYFDKKDKQRQDEDKEAK